jgi:multidrug transporter EmrE-like cation transporter
MNSIDSQADPTPLLAPPLEAAVGNGRTAGGVRGLIGRWWVAFAASSVFVVSGHLLIKAGLNAASANVLDASALARVLHAVLQVEVVAGLLIYVLGSGCWMIAVAQQEISFLYPLSSVNYVLVVVASSVLFHEGVSARRASGVILIVLGMILMNQQSRRASA